MEFVKNKFINGKILRMVSITSRGIEKLNKKER